MSYPAAAETYRRNAILTASPEKLVKLLYDGAIRQMERARQGLSEPSTCRSESVGLALSKALGIVGELRTALDMEKGRNIAEDLDRLYDFCIDRLSDANLHRTPEPVEEALRVFRTLKEGWDAILAS